jgi:predicted GNAT family acetyltransferase
MSERVHGTVEVTDQPDRDRFEVTVDGVLAGFAEYRRRPGRVVFTHTEVGDRFQGQGVAGLLVRAGLEAVRAAGLQVTPLCPYVAEYIRRHPEFVDLVDQAHRDDVRPSSSR